MILTKLEMLASAKYAQLALWAALFCSTAVWAQSPTQGKPCWSNEPPSGVTGRVTHRAVRWPWSYKHHWCTWVNSKAPGSRSTAPDNTLGWVHMFDVTAPASANTSTGNVGSSALRGITINFNWGTGQTPGSNVTTFTLVIRGLGTENLINAQPNAAVVALAEALRVDAAQARQFGSAASLATRTVDALATPNITQ